MRVILTSAERTLMRDFALGPILPWVLKLFTDYNWNTEIYLLTVLTTEQQTALRSLLSVFYASPSL